MNEPATDKTEAAMSTSSMDQDADPVRLVPGEFERYFLQVRAADGKSWVTVVSPSSRELAEFQAEAVRASIEVGRAAPAKAKPTWFQRLLWAILYG